jgi:hypothetical protein
MLIRTIVLVLLLCSACRTGILPCPEVKGIKYRKSAGNFRGVRDRNLSASTRETEEEQNRNSRMQVLPRQTREVKSIATIEEWDCPKPGSKTIPKSVKDNIKKNRRKFETYYKTRSSEDSIQTQRPAIN